jgi:hypothetical protein
MKGHTEDVEIKGQISDPISDPYPLPSGEPALANEVTITAELQLAKQG